MSEMYSRVITGAVHGGRQLSAADRDNITNGLLSFHMVGFMSGEVETIYPVICSNGQKPHNYAVCSGFLCIRYNKSTTFFR